MRFSQLVFTSKRAVGNELTSKNARLLTQASFVHQEMAGVYTFLPLGLRVLNKIEKIIREEMDKISVEILMTALAPQKNWEQTKRLGTVDVLMKTTPANPASQAKNSAEYVLNSTHEEIVTPLVMEFQRSYRALPISVYQIQTKFRNEPRAKSGLLRCREFRMKDAYSFHRDEADLKKYYEVMKQAYMTVFQRLGLGDDTVIALASGGDFTPDFSHEFQTICDAGEDTLFWAKKANTVYNREVAPSQAPAVGDANETELPYEEKEGIGMIGVEGVAKHLGIPVWKTSKTLLFETETGQVVAAVVRGGYDIDEVKLKKVLGCTTLKLASAEVVKKVTKAEVGYAGPLNLPPEVTIIYDESVRNRKNFECGANRTNYHSMNVNFGRDLPAPKEWHDIKVAQDGDIHPETGETYTVVKACEVGNIFPLNTKFSKAFGYTYADEKGQEQPVYMGCYGIGPSRLVGVIVEKFADEVGLRWPLQVAPFHVHLVSLQAAERARAVYEQLTHAGIEVIWDDRDVRAGEKFTDADLIGIPHRILVSAKTGTQVEWKKRSESDVVLTTVEHVIQEVRDELAKSA